MKKDKVYSLIMALCLLASLVLLYNVSSNKKTYIPNLDYTIHDKQNNLKEENLKVLTNESIQQLILSALPSDIPFQNLNAEILENNTIILKGSATKTNVKAYLSSINKLNPMISAGMAILPNVLDFQVELAVKTENNIIILEPKNLTISGLNIGLDAFGQDFIRNINVFINDAIIPLNLDLEKANFEKGKITF